MKHKLATLALIAGTIFSTGALADSRHHHGHGGHRNNLSFSIQFGTPYLYPVYPRYYYSPPVYVAPRPIYIEQPPVYIERAPAPQTYWYFCVESQAYYPHVATCVSPWQRVPANP